MFLGATLVETSDAPLGVELVHSRRATKTATPYDIVALAQVVQRGDEGVHNTACSKLSVIADQIRYLQEQAQQVCHCIWTFNCHCLGALHVLLITWSQILAQVLALGFDC